MSYTDIDLTMSRIETATPRSPIAVFKHTREEFETVFAATVRTQSAIKRNKTRNYIGSYDNTMDLGRVRHELGDELSTHVGAVKQELEKK